MGFNILKWVKLLPDTRNVLGPLNPLNVVTSFKRLLSSPWSLCRSAFAGHCQWQVYALARRLGTPPGIGSPVLWRQRQKNAPDQDNRVYTNIEKRWVEWVLEVQTQLTTFD